MHHTMSPVHHLLLFIVISHCGNAQTNKASKEQECGVAEGGHAPASLDGEGPVLSRVPWHANIYEKRDGELHYLCGGNLIAERIILTAAHCVKISDKKDLRVAFGKLNQGWDEDEPNTVKRNVSAVKVPDEFDWAVKSMSWNIALVKLSQPVEMKPVCLPTPNSDGYLKNNTGYMFVSWNGKNKLIEQKAVSILPNDECVKYVTPSISIPGKICGKAVSFKGDSGGGLTKAMGGWHRLIGITNFKYNDVTLFANLTWPAYADWLKKEINNLNKN